MAYGTYGMSSTPMISPTMPNPMGVTSVGMNRAINMSQPMTTTGLQAGTVRNMNLPLSRATPIQVTEITPNLEEIQNFPVAGRGLDGTHFHQDPVSGQMYVMTAEFHSRIPEILANKKSMSVGNGMFGEVMGGVTNSSLQSMDNIAVVQDELKKYLSRLGVGDLTQNNSLTSGAIIKEDVLNLTGVNVKEVMDSELGIVKNQSKTSRRTYSANNAFNQNGFMGMSDVGRYQMTPNTMGNQQLSQTNLMMTRMEAPIYLTNNFESLASSNLNGIDSISMYRITPQIGTSLEIKHPTNSFPPINSISDVQQMTTTTIDSSYLSNTYSGVVGASYAINQSVNNIGSLPTNTYHI